MAYVQMLLIRAQEVSVAQRRMSNTYRRTTAALLLLVAVLGAVTIYDTLQMQSTSQKSIATTTITQASSFNTPILPSPTSVSVDPETTAVMILDYTFCYRSPGCNATLPNLQALLGRARTAGALVIYTRLPPSEIANKSGDIVILNDKGADKFYNTSLESVLQSKGIGTLVISGIASNGALLYTAFQATLRGYTVVVPRDTVIGTDFVQSLVLFQLLNAPGHGNANNTPLQRGRVTISTTSSIQFKGGS